MQHHCWSAVACSAIDVSCSMQEVDLLVKLAQGMHLHLHDLCCMVLAVLGGVRG